MKKLLLVLAFPMLLISCGKANAKQEVTFARVAEEMEAPQVLKKALKAVGKFSGSVKTLNGALIGMSEDINNSISATLTYTFDNDGVAHIESGVKPTGAIDPYQLKYGGLALSAQSTIHQAFPATGYEVDWLANARSYINPIGIDWELVAYDTNASGGQAVYYQRFNLTFNEDQWLTKCHYIAKINYFENGQSAYYVCDTTATFSYTYY